jgi:hypothetical protein
MMNDKVGKYVLIPTTMIITIVISAALALAIASVFNEPGKEISTIIVRIVDKNQVIHSRIGVIQDGEVIIQLSGKRI